MRKLMALIFAKATRFLAGSGIGRSALVQRIYRFLYYHLISKSEPLPPLLINVECHKMYVHPASVDFVQTGPWRSSYEKYQTELFKRIVKKGMVVVDLGANIGYYTLIAAKLVGEKGKVFAFEPEANNYALLERNIAINGYKNVVPVQKAVSNSMGTTTLFLSPDGNRGWHRIYKSQDGWDSVEIEMVTLGEFFKDKEDSIDVIKMDVEGAEAAVLEGMSQEQKTNDKLIIFTEFSPSSLEKLGTSPERYLNELIKYGFKLYRIDEKKEQIEAVDFDSVMQICAGGKYTNLLCLKGEYEENMLRVVEGI